METAIVIPARYQSTRFPAKPLAPIIGATGIAKPLIARVIEAARLVPGDNRVIVATDDDRIAAVVRDFGAEVAMTSTACRNGTERIAQAVSELGLAHNIIVNIQGDAPLTPPWFVEAIIETLRSDETVEVASPVVPFDPEFLGQMRQDAFAGKKGASTAVFAPNGDALYFSKQVIPFSEPGSEAPVFQHLGLYAYRPEALAAYAAAEPTPLETTETLEQLRFLELGRKIRLVKIDPKGRIPWEANYPADIPIIETQLAALKIA